MHRFDFEEVPVEDLPVARVSKTDLKQMLLDIQAQASVLGELHHKLCTSDPGRWTAEHYREIVARVLETMTITLGGMAALIQLQVNLKDDIGMD